MIVIPYPGIGNIMTQIYIHSAVVRYFAQKCPWPHTSYGMRPVTKYSRIMSSTTLFRTLPIVIIRSYGQRYLPYQLRNLSRLSRDRIWKLRVPTLLVFLKCNTTRLSLRRNTELGSNFGFACPVPSFVVSMVYKVLLNPIHHS